MVTYAVANRIRAHVADMKTYFENQRRHAVRSSQLNAFAAVINLIAWVNSVFILGGWIGWINLPMMVFSGWMSYASYKRLGFIEADKREYVEGVLRGEYG